MRHEGGPGMGEFPHFTQADGPSDWAPLRSGLWPARHPLSPLSPSRGCCRGLARGPGRGYAGQMSPAAAAVPPPGQRSDPSGTAELLCALSYGSGLAIAERMEHGTNTAFVGTQLGRALGLDDQDLEAVFYGALIKDVGCSACGAVLAPFFADEELAPRLDLNLVDMHSPRSMLAWVKTQVRLDPALPARITRLAAFAAHCGPLTHEAMAAHCEIAADFAARLGFGPHVQEAVRYQWERHDGRGAAFHQRADAIPRPAQVLHVALLADVARDLAGTQQAASMVRQRAGSYFAPDVAEAYLDLASGLWPPGDDPVPLAEVLACDPGTAADALPGDRRLAVCEALADFADLKSARRGSHSHTVARLAAGTAAQLGLGEAEQDRVHRAALVHDLGKIAVPYRLLERADDDTGTLLRPGRAAALSEPVRLHPYYAQRILARVHPLADLAADVSAHHERLDGSGYPFGLHGQGVPVGAQVLAAADTWAERARDGTPDLTDEDGLDPACVAALQSCATPGLRHQRPRSRHVSALPVLSSRELQVLRLLTDGASNPDISKALYISRRTTEHHVEHILTKLGVTSRTAAVAYALTHELLT
jgi:HD-GYP domain-containing protein (c-di-GMP phosphodiesterase class II)/DNA-binding CsgD family transcriptional regulator